MKNLFAEDCQSLPSRKQLLIVIANMKNPHTPNIKLQIDAAFVIVSAKSSELGDSVVNGIGVVALGWQDRNPRMP